jgi:organic radical activating enzyme
MIYRVNEIFRSLQGEGVRTGTVNVFLRFSGCNLNCAWCDTDYEASWPWTAFDIHQRCLLQDEQRHRCLVVTGGEPALQWEAALADEFHAWHVAMETNGTQRLNGPVDWLTVSPKTPPVSLHFHEGPYAKPVDELKCVVACGDPVPEMICQATHYLISPRFYGQTVSLETLAYCVQMVKDNPPWQLSVQTHKWLKIR